MSIFFTNTLTKKKELFVPVNKDNIGVYACGITPYDYAHLGHARCFINADIFIRFLRFMNYDVTFVRNYTDIDDKILAKAEQSGVAHNYAQITEKFIRAYQEDMQALHCLTPDHEPRVTQHIPEIINFIEQLIDNKKAYVIDHDVYFNLSSYPEYGKLSGKKIDELEAGSRVKVDPRKKNPGDFVLWKGNNDKHFWLSPWGYGRPGWHIECSVLAKKYLGSTIDIHMGGQDLMFPHHENEIAQSESLHHAPFARYWIHNAFVNINKEKMSKSLGNFITLKDIFKEINPMVLRYFFLQHHYRTPIDFNIDELTGVQTAYKKLIAQLGSPIVEQKTNPDYKQFASLNEPIKSMLEALSDDLNTPKFLGLVFQNLDLITQSPELCAATKILLQNVLGLNLQPIQEKTIEITPEIQKLIDEREKARETKNWTRSDQLRDQLLQLGIKVQDKKK
ncbi:MAG: cysteine--tRNA ligase [bacterium]